MIIKTIIFKREKDSFSEAGIEIEGGPIIDRKGKVVPSPIYNAKDILGLQIDADPILNRIEKIYKTKDI